MPSVAQSLGRHAFAARERCLSNTHLADGLNPCTDQKPWESRIDFLLNSSLSLRMMLLTRLQFLWRIAILISFDKTWSGECGTELRLSQEDALVPPVHWSWIQPVRHLPQLCAKSLPVIALFSLGHLGNFSKKLVSMLSLGNTGSFFRPSS